MRSCSLPLILRSILVNAIRLIEGMFSTRNILTGSVILTLGIIISLLFSLFSYIILYSLIVPSTLYEEVSLRFEYDYDSMLIYSFIHKDYLSKLDRNQFYNIYLKLQLPTEPHNYDALWQIHVNSCDQLDDCLSFTRVSTKSYLNLQQQKQWYGSANFMLKYQSRLVQLAKRMLKLPFLILNYWNEYDTVNLLLASNGILNSRYNQKNLFLTINSSKDWEGRLKLPRISQAKMQIVAQFTITQLAYWMYHYSFITMPIIIALFAFFYMIIFYSFSLIYLIRTKYFDKLIQKKNQVKKEYKPIMQSIEKRHRSISRSLSPSKSIVSYIKGSQMSDSDSDSPYADDSSEYATDDEAIRLLKDGDDDIVSPQDQLNKLDFTSHQFDTSLNSQSEKMEDQSPATSQFQDHKSDDLERSHKSGSSSE